MNANYYFSAKTGGFYRVSDKELYEASSDGWPDDAVGVGDGDYKLLLDGQANGKLITADKSGRPILTDPVIDWQARAEQYRQTLLTAAGETMAPWEREANAGILDDDDKSSLIEWTKYAKVLRKLDISTVKDETGYNSIVWPVKP